MSRRNSTFSYESEAGDFIGQGKSHSYTQEEEVTFTVQPPIDKSKNQISIAVEKKMEGENTHWWHLEFAAPKGQRLKKGTYTGATRFAFQEDNDPGLTMSGCGRGANRSFGEFTVREIGFNRAGELITFNAIFLMRNVGFADPSTYDSIPAVRGKICYYKKSTSARRATA